MGGSRLDAPFRIERARGKVWSVETDGRRPEGDLTVVSTLHLGGSTCYRVVGEEAGLGATAADPGLEDGYVSLMRESRALRVG